MPIISSFQSTNIRTFLDDHGNPWFCTKDVCEVLGYTNYSQTIKDHCREKGISKRCSLTEGGKQMLAFINEGNLYRLITRSKKPETEKFEEMVMDEILPTIRKTGSYHHIPILPNQLEERIQKLEAKYPPINLPVWMHQGDQRKFEAAWQIIKELKDWSNTIPGEIGDPLYDALNQLSITMIAGWMEVDKAIHAINSGLFHLSR